MKNIDYATLTTDMKTLKTVRDRWVKRDPEHTESIDAAYVAFFSELRRIYRDSKRI